jgi:DNA replication factor GINS
MQGELYIEAVRASRELMPVTVAILRSLGRTPFADIELVRGTEVELPRWLAEILERRGYVEVRREIRGSNDINRVRFSEEDHVKRGGLAVFRIPPDFYLEVVRIVRSLEDRVKKGGSPDDLRELEAIYKAMNKIVQIRMQKILLASILYSERSSELEKNLSIEEKALYRVIDDDVKYWLKTALGGRVGGSSQ